MQRRMARQEAPAPRRNNEGDRPPGVTVLAALEVVSDIAAVFCLLPGEGLGPDPPLSAVLRFRDTASGQWTLRSLAPELRPVLLWLHLWWLGVRWRKCRPEVPAPLDLLCSPGWVPRGHVSAHLRTSREMAAVTEFTVPDTR